MSDEVKIIDRLDIKYLSLNKDGLSLVGKTEDGMTFEIRGNQIDRHNTMLATSTLENFVKEWEERDE